MTGATYNHQFAVWPSLGKFPSSDKWASKVKTSMNQDTGNVGKRTRVSQQHPFCIAIAFRRGDTRAEACPLR